MASEEATNPMAESGVTINSDSEQYSAGEDLSTSPPSSSSPPIVLYQPPTLWGVLRGTAINLFLPFINGMMLGFGELFAHEAAFRLGWSGTKVCYHFEYMGVLLMSGKEARWHRGMYVLLIDSQVFPLSRRQKYPIGPGLEAKERPDPIPSMEDLTSLE